MVLEDLIFNTKAMNIVLSLHDTPYPFLLPYIIKFTKKHHDGKSPLIILSERDTEEYISRRTSTKQSDLRESLKNMTEGNGMRYCQWRQEENMYGRNLTCDCEAYFLHFVDVGKDWRLGLELTKLTDLLESLREDLEGMILDGVQAYVEEGFPVCDGPMGLNEFEDAITII